MTATTQPTYTPEEKETIYRKNFFYFFTDAILFMVAMGVIGSNTVVPDFVRQLTSSEILIGLSGTLFTVGFTLPQLFVARYLVGAERKKWWFVGPNIPVRFVILIFAVITFFIGGENRSVILIVFFTAYSIAAFGDGLVGVPWADLSGSSMNERWRSRFFGLSTAATGVIMLAVTPLIGFILGHPVLAFPRNYAVLFGIAGILFVISIIPILFIHELPSGKKVEKITSIGEFMPQMGKVLQNDAPFRYILIARVFSNLFLMSAPFYIGFATVRLGLSSEVAVPILLAMATIGNVLAWLAYAWLGEKYNVLYIRLALLGGAVLPISALLALVFGPIPLYIGFLVSSPAVSSIMLAYLNWIVGHAGADERPIYVGLANTISGVISLIAPIIGGAIAQYAGFEALFVTALVMISVALFVMVRYINDPQPEIVLNPVAGD